MRLVLFDVDGTLVSCGRQVRPLFARALAEVYGTAGELDGYDFAGKTDTGIVWDLMTAAGVGEQAVAEGLPRARELYLEALGAGLRRERMRLLPGVLDLLERLLRRRGISVGLLTGNWERGARIKLSRFDLNRFFPFGAFGDGERERRALPPLALDRAARFAGVRFAPAETLVVGDSLLDVACARAHGMSVLAVATGTTRGEELEAAGADWVVPDLGSAHLCHPVLAA